MVFITCCQAPRWTRTKYQPTELAKDEQPKPEGPCPVRTRTTSPWGRTHVTSSGTVLRIYAAPIKMCLWMDAAYGASHSLSLLSLRTVLKATGHDRARIVPHARLASPPVVCKLVPELIRSRLFLIAWRSSGGAVPSLWIVLLCPLPGRTRIRSLRSFPRGKIHDEVWFTTFILMLAKAVIHNG